MTLVDEIKDGWLRLLYAWEEERGPGARIRYRGIELERRVNSPGVWHVIRDDEEIDVVDQSRFDSPREWIRHLDSLAHQGPDSASDSMLENGQEVRG